ncbi:MAG TPA: hypothetical protein PKD86_03560 [Gemmatales bacterium]|nr:hypothetical protein [Gemmatales bacterium]HMP58410.1 hypothetical protein [Gemmatales bacterium]
MKLVLGLGYVLILVGLVLSWGCQRQSSSEPTMRALSLDATDPAERKAAAEEAGRRFGGEP